MNKSQQRKVKRVVEAILSKCPWIERFERKDGRYKVNNQDLYWVMDPKRCPNTQIRPEIKSWLIESEFKLEDVFELNELISYYLRNINCENFTFIRKSKGPN